MVVFYYFELAPTFVEKTSFSFFYPRKYLFAIVFSTKIGLTLKCKTQSFGTSECLQGTFKVSPTLCPNSHFVQFDGWVENP